MMLTKKKVFAFIALSFVLGVGFVGIEKSYDVYTIQRCWYDSEDVYVLYKSSRQDVRVSLFDIEGTVTKEVTGLFIKRFPRMSLRNAASLELVGGVPAGSERYRDHDFTMLVNGAQTQFTLRSGSTITSECSSNLWNDDVPVRFHDLLFYCGKFFDKSGVTIHEIPALVAQQVAGIASQSESKTPTFPENMRTRLSVAASDKGVMIARNDLTGIQSGNLQMAIWPLGDGKDLKWVSVRLPASEVGYQIQNNSVAYSPNAFILRSSADKDFSVLLCDTKQCKRTMLDPNWVYLIVDSDAREILTLTQQNLTSAKLVVRSVSY